MPVRIPSTLPAVEELEKENIRLVTPYGTCTATRFRPGFSENSYWLTFDLPAILTYTVSFDANGGTCEYNVGIPTTPGGDKPDDNPQTGDNSIMSLWIALLFVSGFGVVTTAVYGKKRHSVK